LVDLFLSKGAELEARNNMGATALMEAAKRPCPATVKQLLEKGANANASDSEGHTPLILAAWNGRTETANLLLAYHADPNAKAMSPDDFDGRPYDAAEAATMRHFPDTASLILESQGRSAGR
jgi:ankyrin repeat protein